MFIASLVSDIVKVCKVSMDRYPWEKFSINLNHSELLNCASPFFTVLIQKTFWSTVTAMASFVLNCGIVNWFQGSEKIQAHRRTVRNLQFNFNSIICYLHLSFLPVQGMCYIQSTDIKSHGDLKSPNCLVDSRWVLKIADYGLPTFKEKQRKTYPSEYAYYRGAY